MTTTKWTTEEQAFFLYVEYRKGKKGRAMIERIFTHLEDDMRNYYIQKIMGDTDGNK